MELYLRASVGAGLFPGQMLLWNHWGKGHYVDPGLAAFVIPEINGADSCDPYQHQEGGEQGEYDHRSPPKRLLKQEQLHRQGLTGLLISGLRLQCRREKSPNQATS